jgi:hypothetical protein
MVGHKKFYGGIPVIVKINGVALSTGVLNIEAVSVANKERLHFDIHDFFLPMAIAIPATAAAIHSMFGLDVAMAATDVLPTVAPNDNLILPAMMPIIKLLQKFAAPVAICYSIWGLVKWMMGDVSGKKHIGNCVIAFFGVYLIPYLFETVAGQLEKLPI